MNYAKMIEILEWVKAGRAAGSFGSRYVCDNVTRFEDGRLATGQAQAAIKADIADLINHSFGVPDFLGLGDDDDIHFGNTHPDVIAFRDTMIENLIARYKEAQNAAV